METRKSRGHVAVVTGAAHGIGQATAQRLAAEGYLLALCDIDADALDALRTQLGRACLLTHVVDVGDAEAMAQFASDVHRVVPAVDILINNAGVGLVGSMESITLDDWQWVLRTNLWGTIHGCNFFVPPMIRRGHGGHVIQLSSVLGYVGVPGVIGYATSKAAILGMSEALRADLAPHNIHVSVICPGLVATDLVSRGRIRSEVSAEGLGNRLRSMYAARGERPEQVANVIYQTIENPRPIVHVSLEAKSLYRMQRWLPGVGRAFGRTVHLFHK